MENSCKQSLHKRKQNTCLLKKEPIVMPTRSLGNGIKGVGVTNPGVC